MPPDTSPAPRGAYAKGIARRQEILERAIDVFARRGSDKTSMRAIASEMGVTHAALAHYFGSREELLVAVYRESERRGNEPATGAAGMPEDAAPTDPSPVESMRESARANREVPGLVQLYSMLVAAALEDGHEPAREFATERFARLRRDLSERVRRDQARGRIRPEVDPEAVAALVIAASDGLQTQWLLEPRAPQDAALTLLDALLAPPPSDAGQ
jgi:AcrR family transcriptional regulator